MNTYQYNINKEIKFIRARSRESALRQIFFGQLKTNGNVDLQKIDLKLVRDPERGYVRTDASIPAVKTADSASGNKVFNQLRHL